MKIIFCFSLVIGWLVMLLVPSISNAKEMTLATGMKKADISKDFNLTEYGRTLTGPAETMSSYKIVSKENIAFSIAIDDDELIHRIYTNDKSFKLPNGIGIGSSFADIKKEYSNYEIEWYQGLGRFVEIDDNVTFWFKLRLDNDYTIIENEEIIVEIEFKNIALEAAGSSR